MVWFSTIGKNRRHDFKPLASGPRASRESVFGFLAMPIHRFSSTQLQLKQEPSTYSRLRIDTSRFHKGAISDEMWTHFGHLVELCHVYRHWQQLSHKMRFPPPYGSVEQASKCSHKKRHNAWKGKIHESERDMYNAARLATDKMADMSRLISNADPDSRLDWKLYSALRLAIAPFPKYERGKFSAAAFRAFDADCELRGEPDEIASRWLGHAGYRAALRIEVSPPFIHARSRTAI